MWGRYAYLIEVVVRGNQLFELTLDIDNLGGWELELDHGHTSLLEVLEEANLGWLQEHQTAALTVGATSSSSDTVDVITGVIWGIKLNDPVDSRNLIKVRKWDHRLISSGDKHQGHEQQHQYRSRYPGWRYRTRRRCLFAFAASAFRAAQGREDRCSSKARHGI